MPISVLPKIVIAVNVKKKRERPIKQCGCFTVRKRRVFRVCAAESLFKNAAQHRPDQLRGKMFLIVIVHLQNSTCLRKSMMHSCDKITKTANDVNIVLQYDFGKFFSNIT